MDYANIPKETKKYIRKSTYIAMDEDERKLYIKSVKGLIHKLEELNESPSDDSDEEVVVAKPYRKLNSRYISFVGMRFREDRHFFPDDEVKLERDDNNVMDPNAVMVMVKKHKKWKHVAYVAREDAKWLRSITGFEKLPLEWEKDTRASCTYSIDLRPLETKGVKVETKKKIVGDKPRKFWVEREWYDYEEMVQYI
ncbi:hypothetical protein BGX28_005525 [Mortierella sp. GBA30]|nr:hypothetical protein BGX28_005525 [Mortierella sp. GBA30]